LTIVLIMFGTLATAGALLYGVLFVMKRNAPDATATAIGTPAEVEAFLKTL
jgi:[acyl-carrier-protein] S-malonyltransferase